MLDSIRCRGARAALLLLTLILVTGLGSARAEMVLHRGNGAEPESLDPHKVTGVPENAICTDLFEGLARLDMSGHPMPGVAERWDVSADGRVYVFHLRPGARWSNGDKVTAEDFAWSLRRAAAPETASDYGPILDLITGMRAWRMGETKDPSTVGVRAVDETTLEIRLDGPAPYLIGLLTHQIAMPVPRRVVETYGSQWTRPGNVVTNGAFVPVEWIPQASLTLARNERWREAKSVRLDKVVYYPTENIAEELKRFRAGELDLTYQVPPEQADMIRKTMPAEFKNSPLLGTYFYTINLTRPPLGTDARLRRALALAIDRQIIVEKVLRRGETPAFSLTPVGMQGYDPARMAEADWTQEAREAEARRLYQAAGYGPSNPLYVEILYNTNEEHKRTAVAVSAMWRKVLGVQVRMINQEWKVYIQSRNQKLFQIARAAWFADYPDPSTYHELYLSTAGVRNDPGYANKRYDALVAQAAQTADARARLDTLREAEAVLVADMPIIPVYQYTSKRLVSTAVKGWGPNALDIYPSALMWVER